MGKRKSVKKSHLKLTGDNYVEKVLDGSTSTENRDCTVRALQYATDIPYWEAHRFFAKHGRKLRSGVPVSEILGRKSRVLFGHRFGKRLTSKNTVKTFLKKHPTGTFYMTVTHHAFCIKDGKVLGWLKSLNQHIECYWRVTKIEKDLVSNTMLPTFESVSETSGLDDLKN